MIGYLCDERAVTVEHSVHVAYVTRPVWSGKNLWITVVAITTTEPSVVVDVSRTLFEVAHDSAPFQNLGEQVRGLLAGEMNSS